MKDWKRQLSFGLFMVLLLALFQSALMAQGELKRPRKFRSKEANSLLRKFTAAERALNRSKTEQDKKSSKKFEESHDKLRSDFVAELEKSLLAETKNGNLDNALEIRSAIGFFKKMKPATQAGKADFEAELKKLKLENEKLRKQIVALGAGVSKTAAGGSETASATQTETSMESGDDSDASDLENTIGMQFRLIPSGNFKMGASADKLIAMFKGIQPGFYAHQVPQHRVRISKPFYMGVHEVTVGQFREFVEATNYVTKTEMAVAGGWGYDGKEKFINGKNFSWRDTGFEQDDNHPVVNVTWHDAVAFCEWLGKKEKTRYQLPTEAQWEYACRAGTDSMFYDGESPDVLMSIANIGDATLNPKLTKDIRNRLSDGCAFTSAVGQYKPNKFGLYDMIGNVGEWCQDWHDRDYYKQSFARDPKGPRNGKNRVMRGWGFRASTWQSRSAERPPNGFRPDHCAIDLGFRVVRVAE